MRNERYTRAGERKATQRQVQYVRELAEQAGYTGDRAYNAAQDLLGDGRGWADSPESASRLISALQAKLAQVQS